MWLAKNLEGERACITFWTMWNDRNNYNNNIPQMDWSKRCEWIFYYWEETKAMQHTTTAPRAMDEAGSGLRSQAMTFFLCIRMQLSDRLWQDLDVAEVHALLHGLRLLQRMQITSALVHSNSINAIKMIRGDIQTTFDVYHWIDPTNSKDV